VLRGTCRVGQAACAAPPVLPTHMPPGEVPPHTPHVHMHAASPRTLCSASAASSSPLRANRLLKVLMFCWSSHVTCGLCCGAAWCVGVVGVCGHSDRSGTAGQGRRGWAGVRHAKHRASSVGARARAKSVTNCCVRTMGLC
jgi:hypothetical protein